MIYYQIVALWLNTINLHTVNKWIILNSQLDDSELFINK